ncbi:MAG: GNAT family N-acyltransferase [Pseudomonadota bacterium]
MTEHAIRRAARETSQATPPLIIGEPIISGTYEVRVARSAWELREAQKLRYRLLYLERGGRPDALKAELEADADEWDAAALHIIVLDRASGTKRLVGTLRLLASTALAPEQQFYTEHAFNIDALKRRFPLLLELGRFCIDSDRRQGAILLLIWKYAMQFIVENQVDLMFGCASFPGTDPSAHRELFSYLYHHNLAPDALRPQPVDPRHVLLSDCATDEPAFESATRSLPTLLRGYLKLGARVSDAAIIDPVFNTTFVCLYVEAREMLKGNTPLVRKRHRTDV